MVGQHALLYGGEEGSSGVNARVIKSDMHALDMASQRWQSVAQRGAPPLNTYPRARRFHVAAWVSSLGLRSGRGAMAAAAEAAVAADADDVPDEGVAHGKASCVCYDKARARRRLFKATAEPAACQLGRGMCVCVCLRACVRVHARGPGCRSPSLPPSLLVHGGVGLHHTKLTDECLGDVHAFEPRTGQWTRCEVSGRAPSARSHHAAALLNVGGGSRSSTRPPHSLIAPRRRSAPDPPPAPGRTRCSCSAAAPPQRAARRVRKTRS